MRFVKDFLFGAVNVSKFESDLTPKDNDTQTLRSKYQLLKKCCPPCVSTELNVNKSKILSELEPFTDYSCTGQIKDNDNNITIKNTTAVHVEIHCGMLIFTLLQCIDKSKLVS